MVSNSTNCFRSHIRCQTGTHSCLGFVIAPSTDFQDILGEILSHFDQVLYQGHLFCSRVGPMTALLFAKYQQDLHGTCVFTRVFPILFVFVDPFGGTMLASSKAIFTCLTLADALYRSGHCWGWPPVPSGQERDSHNSFQCCFGPILVAGKPICTPRHMTRVIDNVGKFVWGWSG